MVESRTLWEVRRNCRRFFEILSLYGLFVCSFVLLVVWVPRKFTLEEGGYVTVQHQDTQYDPVPWPAARVSGRSPSYQLMEGRCHVTDAKAGWEPSQPASCYLFVSLSTSRHISLGPYPRIDCYFRLRSLTDSIIDVITLRPLSSKFTISRPRPSVYNKDSND
jgi:hypothetical protein